MIEVIQVPAAHRYILPMRSVKGKCPGTSDLDTRVGRVAGAVCRLLFENAATRGLTLPLIPTVSFKVKKALCDQPALERFSPSGRRTLIKKMTASIVKVLRLYDLAAPEAQRLRPRIEQTIRAHL